MLSPHQFYRRVAFGINDDESKSNPLASAVSQLSNLKTVKWSHFHPTPIDAIKFLNFIKLTSKKIKKEQGGGQNEVDSYFKEKNIDHDNFRAELAFRAHIPWFSRFGQVSLFLDKPLPCSWEKSWRACWAIL